MSQRHPIIAVTGSSGAGTTVVAHAFGALFRRFGINAAFVNGDAFFRFNRYDMKQEIDDATARGETMSHFGPEANLFEELETLFRQYGENGTGRTREYVKDADRAREIGMMPGEFTPWTDLPANTDVLFYEGLHGGVAAHTWTRRRQSPAHFSANLSERRRNAKGIDVAQHVDLLLGIVPAINLEWIQKIHRDCNGRGYSVEAVTDTILRRMKDYVYYIVPQFAVTDINFQRVPLVDTSNPFTVGAVPSADESLVVVHFRDPRKHDIAGFGQKIEGAYPTRPNTLVIPGGQMALALEVICGPFISDLLAGKGGGFAPSAARVAAG